MIKNYKLFRVGITIVLFIASSLCIAGPINAQICQNGDVICADGLISCCDKGTPRCNKKGEAKCCKKKKNGKGWKCRFMGEPIPVQCQISCTPIDESITNEITDNEDEDNSADEDGEELQIESTSQGNNQIQIQGQTTQQKGDSIKKQDSLELQNQQQVQEHIFPSQPLGLQSDRQPLVPLSQEQQVNQQNVEENELDAVTNKKEDSILGHQEEQQVSEPQQEQEFQQVNQEEQQVPEPQQEQEFQQVNQEEQQVSESQQEQEFQQVD